MSNELKTITEIKEINNLLDHRKEISEFVHILFDCVPVEITANYTRSYCGGNITKGYKKSFLCDNFKNTIFESDLIDSIYRVFVEYHQRIGDTLVENGIDIRVADDCEVIQQEEV